jgi:hypothetical protein
MFATGNYYTSIVANICDCLDGCDDTTDSNL